jgi:flagellar motor switch protein FliN/FliY
MKNPKQKLHPDVLQFIDTLIGIEMLLAKYENDFWKEKIVRVRKVAEKSDGHCVDLFMGLLGGMGSLNDLVLDGPQSVNDELHKLLSLARAQIILLK